MTDPFRRSGHDARLGRALGEIGMDRAAAAQPEWFPNAQLTVLRICKLFPGHPVTGEELGNAVTHYYRAAPRPQAWGALVHWAIRQGLIVLAVPRQRVRMENPRSHGRTTDVYRIIG